MARSLGRMIVILVAVLWPLGIAATAHALDAVDRSTAGASFAQGESGMTSDTDGAAVETDALLEIDDDHDAPEGLLPATAPGAEPSDHDRPSRASALVSGAPPRVHLELLTPPPRG